MDDSGRGRTDFGTGLRAALARARERRANEERPPPEDRALSPELALVAPDLRVEVTDVADAPEHMGPVEAAQPLARLPERNNPA